MPRGFIIHLPLQVIAKINVSQAWKRHTLRIQTVEKKMHSCTAPYYFLSYGGFFVLPNASPNIGKATALQTGDVVNKDEFQLWKTFYFTHLDFHLQLWVPVTLQRDWTQNQTAGSLGKVLPAEGFPLSTKKKNNLNNPHILTLKGCKGTNVVLDDTINNDQW